MKLDNIPYISQYLDVLDFKWTHRSCGMCCVAMIFDYHNKPHKSVLEMCEDGEEAGGRNSSGWIHDYFVKLLKENGFEKANREEKMEDQYFLEKIKRNIENNFPVIASIEQRSLEQTKFHQVLVVGIDENNIYYHEPASLDREKGAYHTCDIQTFLNYSRKMAIFCGA